MTMMMSYTTRWMAKSIKSWDQSNLWLNMKNPLCVCYFVSDMLAAIGKDPTVHKVSKVAMHFQLIQESAESSTIKWCAVVIIIIKRKRNHQDS